MRGRAALADVGDGRSRGAGDSTTAELFEDYIRPRDLRARLGASHRDVTFPERAPGLPFFALNSYEGGPMAGGQSSGGSEKSGNKGSGGKKK